MLCLGVGGVSSASTPIDQIQNQPIYQPQYQQPVTPQQVPQTTQPRVQPSQPLKQYKPSGTPTPSSPSVRSAATSNTKAMPFQECLTVVNMISQNTRQAPTVIERTPTLQKFKFADGAKNNYITCDQSTNTMKMDVQ